MRVVFRTDASLSIGNGHLMRCLTLAAALRERGAACTFVCRDLPGHRHDLVRSRNFALHVLPRPSPGSATDTSSSHAAWLECTSQEDAAQTIAVLDDERPDWLIVDHYALDAMWERALRPFVHRVMVIDDLADRPHDADLLLDQNLGRSRGDYARWVPAGCRLLTGPRYALLRPEFGQLRQHSLARRGAPQLKRLLIGMGGVDSANATGAVLDALPGTGLPADCRISIALGGQAPWRESVHAKAAACAWQCELGPEVEDMAALLAECDLAIGAAGTATWERCCLGVPSILVVLAGNQRMVACALDDAGGGRLLGTVQDIASRLPDALATVADTRVLAKMSQIAAGLCDGNGLERVVETLRDPLKLAVSKCRVRAMMEQDLGEVRRWRNHPDVRRYMFSRHEIGEAEHRAWFERNLADPTRHLLIVEADGEPLGFVQFQEAGNGRVADWGFYVVPDAPRGSGRRMGAAALEHAFATLGLEKIRGLALESNERSIAMHRALGFADEGCLRDRHFDGERYQAVLRFGLLTTEWRSEYREKMP